MNRLLPLPKKIIVAAFILAVCIALPLLAAPRVSDERQKLIDYGLTFQGIRYVYGGSKPESGFDCSGFVAYVADGCGIKLARQTSLMYASVDHIDEEEREPGDLIFFAVKTADGRARISHVGIYLGLYTDEGKFKDKRVFLHSASDGPSTGVIVSSIDEKYWKDHFYGYGRILKPTGIEDQVDGDKITAIDETPLDDQEGEDPVTTEETAETTYSAAER